MYSFRNRYKGAFNDYNINSGKPGDCRSRRTLRRCCKETCVAQVCGCLDTEDRLQGKSFYEEKDYDKMEMVLIEAGDGVDYNGKSITGLLSVLFSSTMGLEEKKDVLSRVYGIEMTKEFEREVKDMCNISRAYYEEGLSKGRMEGSLLILNQLVDKGKLSICDAAAMADMTVEGFLKKKEELKKETL